ncbi:MAG: GNAT family protein [bacterium]|nr:GNAT family protein [bacterium]
MHNPFLVGERIYLRAIEERDLNATYREWFNDEEVCRYSAHHCFPRYDQEMREYYEKVIKSKENIVLAICDKETDAHIGNIALENIRMISQVAEIAIIIGEKQAWGKGIGTEAVRLMLRHGFTELNLHRIWMGTLPDNIGMQKIAIALGFTDEGRAREEEFKGGKFHDVIRYGLLSHEFKS